jgi:agmatinase
MASQFFNLPDAPPSHADVILLPLPYEGTVSYGQGTASGPAAIWEASAQVELWDDELGIDLSSLRLHNAPALAPEPEEAPRTYLDRVQQIAVRLHEHAGLVVGVGGEHSVTVPLVFAAAGDVTDLADVTVVQFDAHADLRDEYHASPWSHACAMRRLIDAGARLIAIGIRSLDRSERDFLNVNGQIKSYSAQALAGDQQLEEELAAELRRLAGRVYLTFDIDALDVHLCPATGTPEPGGLGWWPTLRLLRTLLHENHQASLIGCDVVETVPLPGSRVNEFVAAKLIAKVLAYRFARRATRE